MVASVYLPLVLLSAVVGMGFALFAWLNRTKPGAKPLTAFLIGASFLAVAEGISVADGDIETMRLWTQIGLSLSVVFPVAWLVTALQYTDNERWLSKRALGLLFVEPVVFVGLVWTNDNHGSVWSNPRLSLLGEFRALTFDFGLAFWGHQVYSYLLLAVGVALVVRVFLRVNLLYRWQSTALLGAISVAMLANALYIFELLPAGLGVNGIAYVFTGIVLTVALLETELLSVAPVTRDIGREAVMAELADAIFILDDTNRIVDVNGAGETLLGSPEECLGRPLSELQPTLADRLDTASERTDIELEVGGKNRYYDVSLSPLYRGVGAFSGRVVSLREVTERRQREQRLDVLNRLLRHNVRNELNLVRGKIELARVDGDDGEHDRLAEAIGAVDQIVDRSNKVGRLSRLLETEDGSTIDIATELRGEHRTGTLGVPGGEVTVALPDDLVVSGGESLVAVFDELVTNGIEHSDSAEPHVTVTVDEDRSDDSHAIIEVLDNGPGIAQQEVDTLGEGRETPLQHSSGVGLWLVTWVVQRAGGTVDFENTDDGCRVDVRLPRGDGE